MKKIFFRLIFSFVLIFFLGLVSAPYLLYMHGLSLVDSKPKPPGVSISENIQREIWKKEKGVNFIKSKESYSINAYSFIWYTFFCNNLEKNCRFYKTLLKLSNNAVYWHLSNELKDKKAINWKISSISMSIWVINNWKFEEILQKVYEDF